MTGCHSKSSATEKATGQIIVIYKVKSDQGDINEKFVKRVFAELKEKAPSGIRYGTLRMADGVTFVHIASVETQDGSNPLPGLDAFKEFQAGLKERCEEPPIPSEGSIVGTFGIFE